MPKQLKGGRASRVLSEDEFLDAFNPITKDDDGELFEFNDIKNANVRSVWSVTESGDEDDFNLYALPGFVAENNVGYVLSETPWTDDISEAVFADRDEVPPMDPEDEYDDENEEF